MTVNRDRFVFNIVLSGLFVSVGMLVDAFIRIGHDSLLTYSVYILAAILLPLELALISGVLIDTLSQVLQGQIGTWWWSFAIQPIIIILIAKGIYVLLSKKKVNRNIIWIAALFITLAVSLGIYYLVHNKQDFTKTGTKQVTMILAALGITLISIWMTFMLVTYRKQDNKDIKTISIVIVVVTSILMDWFINPMSAMEFYTNRLHLTKSWNKDFLNVYIWKGIGKSLMHMFVATGIVSGTIIALKATTTRK